jgi:phenylacetate-CoA ligase
MLKNLAERLFLSWPPVRNTTATIWGYHVNRERYGRYYHEALPEIAQRDRSTTEQLRQFQNQRIVQIVETASRHIPYYRSLFRKLGLSPHDIHGADDLEKLPILEKEEVRKDPFAFVDERIDRRTLKEESTTGTTGTPVRSIRTARAYQTNYAYFEVRCRGVAGLRYADDYYVMFGCKHVAPINQLKPPFWCYNHASRQLYMSSFHLAPWQLRHYCEELRRRPYAALMGYPAVVATVGQYLLDEGIADIRIPIAITNGETLYPSQRRVIERAFSCRVFDQFGCTELAAFAAERCCGRMHISPDYGVMEIVDDLGTRLPHGKVGHLICTGLINEAQILLRYRMGDRASLGASPCGCGSSLPLVESMNGRTSAGVLLADGRITHELGPFAEHVYCLKQHQIIQEGIGRFTVRVVATPEFGDVHRAELTERIVQSTGPATVRFEVVDQIERGPGGKFQLFISRIEPGKIATGVRQE